MSDAYKTVGDVMTRQIMVLRIEDNLDEVMKAMKLFQIHHVPVVDGEKLVGMVSHRDMLSLMHSRLQPLASQEDRDTFEHTFVMSVMTRDPVSVAPELTLANAVRILQERRVGCLPVVSEGKLIGLLTETDLLRVLGQMLDAQER